MPSATNYSNLLDANRGVLAETCEIMSRTKMEYVVVGGWVPYLRGAGHTLHHPGTSDVDLLFNGDFDGVRNAIPEFFKAGYVPSAKHPFQLLKELTVGGKNFVFNVDLMYPAEAGSHEDLFHDIIDLGVRRDGYSLETHKMKSIAFLSADVIFYQSLWSDWLVSATTPDGRHVENTIPLMDERGLILSKCESVKGIKRGRDAFDIYFVLSGPNGSQTADGLKRLANQQPGAKTHLERLRAFVATEAELFDERVAKYAGDAPVESSAGLVLRMIPDFGAPISVERAG